MLRIISCHGMIHPHEKFPHDFIAVVDIPDDESSDRPLTGEMIVRYAASSKILSLTCFCEDDALSKYANDLYPLLRYRYDNESAIKYLHGLVDHASMLYHRTRQQALPKAPLPG